MTGSTLDKYEVLEKVGEGGMATVYRGRHVTLGRDVAIKILHPHLSASERNRRRFAREARAIEHLDHDNILRIFDYSGTGTENCYIVTEFVDGETLQQLITDQGRLPAEVTAMIGAHLAEALGYAHQLGIIHRDLKPENVMVRRDGAVKLMDFGIARFLDEVNLTLTGALVGSPAYMSPEQAMERVLDSRSDLFSLGTLLFHAVTGQLPFSGSNPSIILRNIIEGNRPEVSELAPDISPSLAEVIERLLQTDPDDRLQSCDEARDKLLETLAEVHIDPRRSEWSLQTWVIDPERYAERIRAHLSVVLLDEGRARLAAGDHLGALRQLNRLLSVDEDNEEVLELVQSMHSRMPREREPRRGGWWVAAVVGTAAAGLFTWALWPTPPAEPSGGPAPVDAEGPGPTDPPAPRVEQPPESAVAIPAEPGPDAEGAAGTDDGGAPEAAPPTTAPRAVDASPSKGAKRRSVPPPPPPPPPIPGRITVVVPGSWGEIYVDGKHKGQTGEVGAIPVGPGSHELRVENPYSKPWVSTFEIAPGETPEFVITGLVPKPAVARLGAADPACRVALDGRAVGTVGSLGAQVSIEAPRSAHVVLLTCPDGRQLQGKAGPTTPGQAFDLPLQPVGAP
jgi:serine/threonine-protein kinase